MEYIYTYPWISLLQLAFTVWMLVDCYRRQADTFWFWVILLVPVVGPWVYFFAVKAADFRSLDIGSWFQRRASLDELYFRVEQGPTLTNRLALAKRLMERQEYEEAIPFLEAALPAEPDHPQLLYSLAVCHTKLGRPGEAIPLLEKVIGRDLRWSNYAAWPALIEAREEAGDRKGMLESCRELVRLAPTLQNRCLLAEHLLDEGQTDEARALLEKSLQDHYYAPGPVRRRNGRWVRVAKRLHRRTLSQSG